MVVGRIVGNAGDIAHGAMSEALWLNVGGCVRIESWVRINRVCLPEYQHWLRHKDLYGPISSVTLLGTTLVIIHDKKAAYDLLEKTSIKTSGRPSMTFANKLCGYERIVLCQGYNSTFRQYRKLLHQDLGTKVSAAQFQDAQEVEVNRQLVRVLNEPDKWLEHLKT
jgi:hypothetical protein